MPNSAEGESRDRDNVLPLIFIEICPPVYLLANSSVQLNCLHGAYKNLSSKLVGVALLNTDNSVWSHLI